MGDCFSHLGLNAKERIFASRCGELACLARERGITRFTPFLDEREQSIASCAAATFGCKGGAWGGFGGALRAVYAFSEEDSPLPEEYPISSGTVRWRKNYMIHHRDLLGTLMSLQIKRETIGDILVGEGEAVLFILPSVAPILLQSVTKVGGVGIVCEEGHPMLLPQVRKERHEGIAASLRADCITAMLTGKSRSEAARLIRAGLVAHGGRIIINPSCPVAAGESISIRGVGKFFLCGVGNETRSGRLHVAYEKYI